MKRLINSCILPVSLIGSYTGCYCILKAFDVPMWFYRGLTSICISFLITLIAGCIWLAVSDSFSNNDDDILSNEEKDENNKSVIKVYGSDE